MNMKAFFGDALRSALDLNIGTPDDVLRHVTPDVLAAHLPRPLWARLLTACLGAGRLDAQLVVETIGIPNLCEHIPSAIIWACIADIGARSLGAAATAPEAVKASASGRSVLGPPPGVTAPSSGAANAVPVAIGPNIPAPTSAADRPLGDLISELEKGDEPRVAPVRARTATANRFRQSNTGISRSGLGGNARRPQAAATPPPTHLPRPNGRRGTEVSADPEPETAVQSADWREKEIAVDDSQLVDWQTDIGSASPITGDEDFSDLGRKR